MRATRPSSRSFYVGMSVSFLLTVIIGFSNSHRLRAMSGAHPLALSVRIHAALFFSWFLILLLQAALIRSGRVAVHRIVGTAAAVLAALIVVDGPVVAISAARRGALPGDALAFMLVMIGDVLGFGAFVAAAVYLRGNGEVHKRLMLLASTSLLPPAIFRWPLVTGSHAAVGIIMVAFLAVAPLRDRLTGGRVSPVSLWGAIALLVSVPLRIAIAQTAAWHQFAAWLIG